MALMEGGDSELNACHYFKVNKLEIGLLNPIKSDFSVSKNTCDVL